MGLKFVMTVRAGPEKGAVYQLLPPRVTIGRGPNNNVSLQDPRLSRQAAVIDFFPDKITLKDLSTHANVFINEKPIGDSEAHLKNGDLIKIGSSEFVFIVEAVALANTRINIPNPLSTPTFGPAPFPRPQDPGSDGKRLRFYGVVGLILLGLAWLLMSNNAAKPKEAGIRTVEEIEKEIKGSEDRVEQIVKRRQFKDKEDHIRYEEAQMHYLQGFRDYQQGQWTRAIRSFETARAIDPEHDLARRYSRLAEKKRDEATSQLMQEGRRYKEKSMYTRCSSALDKVLEAIMNHDDVRYKQAEALKKECDLLIEERFR
jgi:pSer/pThr/pTyr-binding forkhead associated (FHA) protein